MRTFQRALRTISIVTLFFFTWTFLPLFQLAAYGAESRKSSGVKSEGMTQTATARPQSTGDRFEKALDAIRENVAKAGDKAEKGEDDAIEREAIKTNKATIESADGEFRKEFSETEKKLKDANLPKEILDRHNKFVKNYDDNLKELKANLDDMEQAKTKSDRKAKIEKARLHLEKTKKPSMHQKLDPNNLPFQARKASKTREPRLKKEEFEKDFPARNKKKSNFTAAVSGNARKEIASWNKRHEETAKQKPIIVASNGSLDGLLVDKPVPFSSGDNGDSDTEWFNRAVAGGFDALPYAINDSTLNSALSPLILAATTATTAQSSDDLAETPEVQFTDDIKAKAAELGYNPVKIYEYVRNNIEYVPTYGSIHGADMCLQTKQCNDMDTASLLIALLRASNISARYVYGTIEMPIDKVMNWVGGFSNSTSALNFIASGGIPVTGLRTGGIVDSAKIEHVWVKAYIDYIPSLGAIHKTGDTWIALDASYKQYTNTEGVDFQSAVPFDAQNLTDQIKATATINEQESYVTNVNSTVIENALNDYNSLLETYVTDNLPNATPGDILGKKEIIKKEQPILPASLPYKVIVAGVESTEVSDSLRHKVTIKLANADYSNDTVFTYTASLPQLAGKRVTVSYDPATDADQAIIDKYAEEYATSMPAYLVQFKPVLKIEGTTVATGAAIGMGNAQSLTISLTSSSSTNMVTHSLLTGDYTAIGINASTVSLDALQKRVDKNDYSEPVGEMLHQVALSYWAEADAFNGVIAKTLRVNNLRHPSELAAAAKVSVSYVWGVPTSATYESRTLDVKLDNQSVGTKSTDKTNEYYFMQQSGTNSSFLEGAIYDQLFGGNVGDSISAVTALELANEQGIPIYMIDSSNVTSVLPKLQVSNDTMTDVFNAVNAGLQVRIPQKNITKSDWTGVGYIILNTTDGSGAYRISGGLNGDVSKTPLDTVIPLPQVTISGTMAFVIASIVSNSEAVVKMGAGLTVLKGLAIPVGVVLIDITSLLLLAILIYAIVKSLAEKFPPQYRQFRHYTSYTILKLIQSSMRLLPSTEGDLGPAGVYVTESVILDPQGPGNAAVIAQKLNMPDVSKIQTYVDVGVNVSKVIMVNGKYRGFPDQFILYMPMPAWGYIPLDNDTAKVVNWGPFGTK